MCIVQGKTLYKHNELTYRHKRNKKKQNIIYLPTVKKREMCQNKWHRTNDKLPIEKK